jgi:hypothetical protein
VGNGGQRNVPKSTEMVFWGLKLVWDLDVNGMRCECEWKWGEMVRNNSERAAAKMGGNFDVLRFWG